MGEYQHTIDAKGRVSVPAKFRDALQAGFVVTKGMDECLFAFPREQWEQIVAKLSTLSMTKKSNRAFSRQFLAGASEVELDKLGRILLPANLRTYAALEKDVVLTGVGSRFEIWDKQVWENYSNQVADEYESIVEEVLDFDF